MGVTIHYSGVLSGAAEAELFINEASAIAAKCNWKMEIARPPKIGLTLFPHPDCEPLSLDLDEFGMIESWVKTQFAGPETHIQIVDFFSTVSPYFETLTVEDEGEFWETRDREKLESHMQQIRSILHDMQQENLAARVQVRMDSGRIVDIIT